MWTALSLLWLALAGVHVKATLSADPARVAPGATFRLSAQVRVDPGWHVYSHDFEGVGLPTSLKLELPEGFTAAPWEWPAPKSIESFGNRVPAYEGTFTAVTTVSVAPSAAPGARTLRATLAYQSCDETSCINGKDALSVDVEVAAGAAPAAAPASRPAASVRGELVKRPTGTQDHPVRPELEISDAALAAGEEALVTVTLRVRHGWHFYAPASAEGMPAAIAEAAGFEIVGALEGPPPAPRLEKTGKTSLVYEGEVVLKQRVRATGAPPGGARPSVTFGAMACDERSCLPPARWVFELPVAITGSAAAAPTPREAAPAGPTTAVPKSEPRGETAAGLGSMPLLAFLGFAAAGGAASLLTPCVFPMVPITISFFSKRSGGSRRRTLKLAVVYALGIILTFTAIGVAVSLLFGATGLNKFATNIWVNLGLALLFVGLGLSLLGLFQIAAPTGLMQKVETAKAGAKGDVSLTLLMAIAFTLASFTCTVPILAGLLGYAATGAGARPVLGMLAYSGTFAAPFFLLALFPSALRKLPRSGAWLETVKVSMGFVELVAALKFFSNADIGADAELLTRPVFVALTVALLVALALYLFGVLRMAGAEGEVGPVRALFGVGTLAAALYLATGLFGARFGGFTEAFLPPPDYGRAHAVGAPGANGDGGWVGEDEIEWERDFDAALARAKREGKRLFLDFTGFQCVNCRAMEQTMFPRPRVVKELKRFVCVQLHVDAQTPPEMVKRSERYIELEQRLVGTTAIPYYVILENDGSTVVASFPGYSTDVEKFVAFLRKG